MQVAQRIKRFRESVIREMTRLAIEHEAINLSQGFPDFNPPLEVMEGAVRAIRDGHNQYSPTWGLPALREKLAEQYTSRLGWEVDAALHVTVTCGVTEAINVAMLALLNPGDQILLIEPAHENFIPSATFAGAEPVAVPLTPPDYRLDAELLAQSVTTRTRALLLNTPHNPSGRVFDETELSAVAAIVESNDLVLITDEIYDRMLYDGREHRSPGKSAELRERTITVGGLSKTFAMTDWRLGYIVAPTALAAVVRPVHDFLTVRAPTPLQAAAVTALSMPQSYYDEMLADYHRRREVMMTVLHALAFSAATPQGSYYVLAEYSGIAAEQARLDSTAFAIWLTKEVGVAVVPGTVFYSIPGHGESSVRFAFPKQLATLRAAGERLERLRA